MTYLFTILIGTALMAFSQTYWTSTPTRTKLMLPTGGGDAGVDEAIAAIPGAVSEWAGVGASVDWQLDYSYTVMGRQRATWPPGLADPG